MWQKNIMIPILGKRTSVDMSGFQTKSLTITIVSGNGSRIFPCNFMACLAHTCVKPRLTLSSRVYRQAFDVLSQVCKTYILSDPDILSRNHRMV